MGPAVVLLALAACRARDTPSLENGGPSVPGPSGAAIDAAAPVRPGADTAVTKTAGPELPVAAVTVDVPGDLPVYVVPGRRGTTERIVFFHGACTHGLGYIQAFAFAASARGTIMALQGERDCGRGLRMWTSGAKTIDARIRAGFSAAGIVPTSPDGTIVAIGYSQGANVAAALAATFPATYRRLILIGAPQVVDASRLGALEGAVLMAGTFDNPAMMRESARVLAKRGVPATYLEIPNARHGQLNDAENVMGEALTRLARPSRRKRVHAARVSPEEVTLTSANSTGEMREIQDWRSASCHVETLLIRARPQWDSISSSRFTAADSTEGEATCMHFERRGDERLGRGPFRSHRCEPLTDQAPRADRGIHARHRSAFCRSLCGISRQICSTRRTRANARRRTGSRRAPTVCCKGRASSRTCYRPPWSLRP